jgi:hypothetical protein
MRFSNASRWLRSSALAAFVVFAGIGCGSLPESAVAVLDGADQYKIFALEPHPSNPQPGDPLFHGNLILAEADVKDPNARENISAIVNSGVRKGGSQSKCFNPRHGIHATRAGRTVDLLICYECPAIEVRDDSANVMLTTGDVQSELDEAFRAAGVSRPK